MLLRGEQLPAHLERELKPVYALYGGEPLLVIEAADTIRTAARQHGFAEREVLTAIAGFNWNDLHHATGSMLLFGERKLIDLRIPTGKPGREGKRGFAGLLRATVAGCAAAGNLARPGLGGRKGCLAQGAFRGGRAHQACPPNAAELPA